MKEQILEYVYNSRTINSIFNGIIMNKDMRELMKSDIYLILCEMDDEKLEDMYNNGKIDGFIAKLALNQWNSNTSDFYKNWRNGGFRKSLTKDSGEFNIEPKEDEESVPYSKYIKDIDIILNNIHWYHKTLFELYYKEGLTYKQISDSTEIKIISVRNSIKKTTIEIKKQLKNKYKDEL
jgi:hypothetical protein